MATATTIKRKARRLAEDAEDRIDDAQEDLEIAAEDAEARMRSWIPVLAVGAAVAVGLILILRRRRMSRLQRGAHEAVDKAFRLSSEARDSARVLADRGSRWLEKVPRIRVEMP